MTLAFILLIGRITSIGVSDVIPTLYTCIKLLLHMVYNSFHTLQNFVP